MSRMHKQNNHTNDAIEGLNDGEETDDLGNAEAALESEDHQRADTASVAVLSFTRWFWGSIIVLALIAIMLSSIAIWRQNSTAEPSHPAHEISASTLRDVLSNPKDRALDAVLSELPERLDRAYKPVYAAITDYADFHYSLKGEYTELYVASLGDPAEKLQSIVFNGLDQRLERITGGLDDRFNEVFKAQLAVVLQREESAQGAFGVVTQRVIEDVNARIIYTAPLSASSAVGGAVALSAAAKAMSKKLAAKVATKAAAKSGGKLASTLTGAGTAALACGPAAPVCGVVGGAVAWFVTDYGILMVDESWNREDFENDLRVLVDDMKEAHRLAIEQALVARAGATAALISEVVEYQSFTVRELNNLGMQKLCSVATQMSSNYAQMSNSIEARAPKALETLRETAAAYEGHVSIGRLADEIKKNLTRAEDIKAVEFELSGHLPAVYRADREISAVLVLNGQTFNIKKMAATADKEFSIRSAVDAALKINQPLRYNIVFEQHLRLQGNRYFKGAGEIGDLAEAGVSDGLSKHLELQIAIARDSSSNVQQVVNRQPVDGSQVKLALRLNAPALPPLEMLPAACQ